MRSPQQCQNMKNTSPKSIKKEKSLLGIDTLKSMTPLLDSEDFLSAEIEITDLDTALVGLLFYACWRYFRCFSFLCLLSVGQCFPGPRAVSDCGVSSQADSQLCFLQQQPGWRGRMETEICAKIYPHGVSCEPRYEFLQWCMFSSQQGAPVARLCITHETVEYSLHSCHTLPQEEHSTESFYFY